MALAGRAEAADPRRSVKETDDQKAGLRARLDQIYAELDALVDRNPSFKSRPRSRQPTMTPSRVGPPRAMWQKALGVGAV